MSTVDVRDHILIAHSLMTRGGPLTVTLDESPVTRARYCAPLRGATLSKEGTDFPQVGK
jgi:hypothetical protein